MTIGNAELWHGDCREVLPLLPKCDLILTDPPYGIGEAAGKNKSRSKIATSRDYGNDSWDDEPPPRWVIEMMRAQSDWQIMFGGNYYDLPPARCWLVWDKDNGETDFADCELAWTNLDRAVRLVRHLWSGPYMRVKESRSHPTQKPVRVMEWSIGFVDGETILDPFMGSGTTGVACANLGRKFIGIEIEPKYFDMACERIENAQRQVRLFA